MRQRSDQAQPGAKTPTLVFLMVLLSGWLAACASVPGTHQARPLDDTLEMPAARTAPIATKRRMGRRRAFGLAQAMVHWARTRFLDPIIRPLTTQKALAALLVKSAHGFVQRTATNAFAMPSLKTRPIPEIAHRPGMDLDRWESDLDRISGTRAFRGRIRFLVDGAEFFDRMIEVIHAAEQSIDIRTYIFDNDDYAVQIADLLKTRSEKVRVKVLLDGLGYLAALQVDSDSLPSQYSPPLSMVGHLRQGSRIQVRTHTNPWFTGDHSKSTIVDGSLAFVGGMNIGREYRYDWHDMMMEVTGPIVNILQHDSDKFWAKAGLLGDAAFVARSLLGRKSRASSEGYPVRALFTLDHNSQIYRAQLAAIRRAQQRIFIENAYFSDDLVLYELARARRRGVDVRVILAAHGDDEILNRSNQLAINTMLRHGIRIYLYPGMSHIKAAIYDGWACMGSANFDKLSLQINRELNLATSNADTVDRLYEQVFFPDFQRSREILEPVSTGLGHRVAEFLADELL